MPVTRWFVPYFLVSVVHVVSLALQAAAVANATKFLLMPALILAVVFGSRRRLRGAELGLIAALLFAWAGDIFLSNAGSSSFVIGLAAFLLAHIVYLVLFLGSVRTRRIPWATAVLVVWWVGMLVVLHNDLGSFLVPLAVYGLALGSSTAAAFATNPTIAAGALLFLASDTSLAWALFAPTGAWWNSDAVIMFLYTAGQLLIVLGFLRGRNRSVQAASVSG